MASAPTLELVATTFRRQKKISRNEIELEIRVENVTYEVFAAVLAALLEKKSGDAAILVDDGVISHVINSIKVDSGVKDSASHSMPQRIRQLTFVEGKKATDKNLRKTQLMPPFRVRTAALPYKVVVSEEAEEANGAFLSGGGATIRAKTRAGFVVRILDPEATLVWRVDMTVVRTFNAAETNALLAAKNDMFGAKMTPGNMVEMLRLNDPVQRKTYQFEIEIEYLKSSPAGGSTGALRPGDITRVANAVFRLAKPHHAQEVAYQTELAAAAKIIYAAAPARARQYESELGLKRLVPQVVALTRADYRARFPPVGFLATEKADGLRSLVLTHPDRVAVLADKLYVFERKTAHNATTFADMEGSTLVDAEFTPPSTVEIFDVIRAAGVDVSGLGIEKRITYAAAAASTLKEYGLAAVAKPYAILTADNLEKTLKPMAKHRPNRDGIIFAAPGSSYLETQSYKWKPIENNTIEFLVRRCPKSLLGRAPFQDRVNKDGAATHELHLLFNGINPDLFRALRLRFCPGYEELGFTANDKRGATGFESYFPVQFQPSDMPLAYLYWHPAEKGEVDKKIVEMRRILNGARPSDPKPDAKSAAAKPDAKTAAAKSGAKPDAKSAAAKPDAKTAAAKSGAKPAAAKPDAKTAAAKPETSSADAVFVNWEMVKLRADRMIDLETKKYYGNDFRIAELTWLNFIDPFDAEQLWAPTGTYFAREKSGIYRAQTGFISYVKERRIETMRRFNTVVDLCFGQGADLGRYMDAEVGTLIAVDRDSAALAEAVRRKYSHISKRAGRGARDARRPGIALHTVLADVGRPFAETVALLRRAGLPEAGADAVVMNLALHYFMGSTESMSNLVALCHSIVAVDGIVTFTALLGREVVAALAAVKPGKTWDRFEDEALKYSLKRLYASDTLQAAGQKIGVLLPFSNGEYYEEYLVNATVLQSEFHKRGFETVVLSSISKRLGDFRAQNPELASQLTESDIEYVSLYGELTFRRLK